VAATLPDKSIGYADQAVAVTRLTRARGGWPGTKKTALSRADPQGWHPFPIALHGHPNGCVF
jgi:hypothetical protein